MEDKLELHDTNGNGIPDVFENRPPLTEILNAPPNSLPCDAGTVIVEMETTERSPKQGELYVSRGRIEKAKFDYSQYGNFKTLVIRRVISGDPRLRK